MDKLEIKEKLRNYLLRESMINKEELKDETLIFDSGLLDSMGLLFLVEFINESFEIEIVDDELNPKNFESIDNIAVFVKRKLQSKIEKETKF